MPAPTTTLVERPSAAGYGCRLGNRLFRLAVTPQQPLTPRFRPPDTQLPLLRDSPEEFVDEHGRTFARSDFTGGEGLQYAHDRNNPENASSRYWDSYLIDTSKPAAGGDRTIKLLHTTASIETLTGNGRMAYDGSTLYVVDGADIRSTADPLASSPTWATEDPHAAEGSQTVLDVATLGTDVYAAITTNGIHRDTGGGWAHWNDLTATRIWGAKNRIVASDGASIYEVTASGAAPSALKTIDTGLTFNDVIDGGPAILAAASDGYVYAFTPTGTSGALELAAQDLFQGEQVVSLAYSSGQVFVGTSQSVGGGGKIGRAYRCELSGSYTLTGRQLLREWGTTASTVDRSPVAAYGTRSTVWWAVRSEDGTEAQTWRYDVSLGSLSRWHVASSSSGLCRSYLQIGDKAFFSVDADEVYRQTDTYASSGWLISPLADFFSASDKTWVSARLDTNTITGSEQVLLQYAVTTGSVLDESSADWATILSHNGIDDRVEKAISTSSSRYIAGQVILSGDGTSTPEVRSFSFRAFPSDFDVEVLLPINVSDRIERPNRSGRRIRGRGKREYDALVELKGQSVTLEIYDLDLFARGQLTDIAAPVPAITERGSWTSVAVAVFRGRTVEETTTPAMSGPLGGHMIGGVILGGEDDG